MNESYNNDYIERLKQIPIADVLRNSYGIEIRNHGNRSYCKIRHESVASCVIYQGNTWYDFGAAQGGSVIDLVKFMEDCTTAEAMNKLGERYGIERPSRVRERGKLTEIEWRELGIEGDRASKNINVFVREGNERPPRNADVVLDVSDRQAVAEFQKKYYVPMSEFKESCPDVYARILKTRGIGYLLADKRTYITNIYSTYQFANAITKDVASRDFVAEDKDLNAAAQSLNRRARLIKIAATGLKNFRIYWKNADVANDLNDILSGKTEVVISRMSMFDLGLEVRRHKTRTCDFIMPTDVFSAEYGRTDLLANGTSPFEKIPHAAVTKGGICTLSVPVDYAPIVSEIYRGYEITRPSEALKKPDEKIVKMIDEAGRKGTVTTSRGIFRISTDMTQEDFERNGFYLHHTSDDGKFGIMSDGHNAYAVELPDGNAPKLQENFAFSDKLVARMNTEEKIEATEAREHGKTAPSPKSLYR